MKWVVTKGNENLSIIPLSFLGDMRSPMWVTDRGSEFRMIRMGLTGGKGQYTQWVHCELIVGSETICLAHTQQVNGGHF